MILATRTGFVAPPNPIVPQRRAPASLGGGIALFAAVSAALYVAGASIFALALIPAVLAGLLDDIRPLRPLAKLAGQFIAACLGVMIALADSVSSSSFPGLLAAGIVLAVVLMNAINLLDVSDGYASLISSVSFAGLAWVNGMDAALAVCGACLGFVGWNWPPARIYLGEAGAQMLGMAGALIILNRAQHGAAIALLDLSCFGVALLELTMLVAIRTRRGIAFWHGSPDHSALLLQKWGLSKQAAALTASLGQLLIVLAAMSAAT